MIRFNDILFYFMAYWHNNGQWAYRSYVSSYVHWWFSSAILFCSWLS